VKVLIIKKNQIGDMVLSLPMASIIKRHHPEWKVFFLGQQFNLPVVSAYRDADGFVDLSALLKRSPEQQIAQLKAYQFDVVIHVTTDKDMAQLMKQAGIPIRIGTRNRWYHWVYCNRRPAVSRKKSLLNEAQLDCLLLEGLGISAHYSRQELARMYAYDPVELTPNARALLDDGKFNLLIHPLTRGRHIEWPMKHYVDLIKRLPAEKFNVITTEHINDLELVSRELTQHVRRLSYVNPCDGSLSLTDLISLIHHADGMIASSTGPIHLAASAGKFVLGLYAPIKPFDGARWGPIGVRAQFLSLTQSCSDCRDLSPCRCVSEIKVHRVYKEVMHWLEEQEEKKASSSLSVSVMDSLEVAQ
jgi:heptosyltransferase III